MHKKQHDAGHFKEGNTEGDQRVCPREKPTVQIGQSDEIRQDSPKKKYEKYHDILRDIHVLMVIMFFRHLFSP